MASLIISEVGERFDQARTSGDLFFFPSTIHHHQEAGVEFEIRLCPALQKKPKLPTPQFDDQSGTDTASKGDLTNERSKPDPFAPPYIQNLLIGELKDEDEGVEYVILLNKFSVVPSHFLLIPKGGRYRSQTTPLYPSELVQIFLLLDAARKTGKRFFAFYNCGDRSGASQHHKHVQFMPVEDDGPPIEKVARTVKLESDLKAFTLNSLPYATHVRRLPSSLSSSTSREELEDTLGQVFMTLLDLTFSTVRHDTSQPVGRPSYNVILTLQHMFIVPRGAEEHVLVETGDSLSVNALGFAGMLLVKSERELEAVKKEGVLTILRSVGLPNVHDQQIQEAHETDLSV